MVKINWGNLVLALLLTVVFLFYVVPALFSGNFLWFVPVFRTQPEKVVVYRAGEQIILYPSSSDYKEVTAACNRLISRISATYQFGLSESGLQEARENEVAVELFYAEPLDLPTPLNLGGPNQLFIPLSGWRSETPMAVRGFNGEYWGQVLRIGDLTELQQVVAEVEG